MDLIEKFTPVLVGTPVPSIRDPRLLIDKDEVEKIKIYYAPFDYINHGARMVLVGITPGPTQMENANNVARRLLKRGAAPAEVLRSRRKSGRSVVINSART